MAYHSFKRVLGETSLERKCRFFFGTSLLLLITGSFWWYGTSTDQLVMDANRLIGRMFVDTILQSHHWEKLEEAEQPDNIFIPQYVGDALKSQDYDWRVILPLNAEGISPPRDERERELLKKWKASSPAQILDPPQTPKHWGRPIPGENKFQYYQPIYAKKECIDCHRVLGKVPNPHLTDGNLMGIIEVSFSDEETVTARNKNRAVLLATAIISVFLAMIALYVIVRYVIVKPLTHLRDVSDEISRGNTQLRANIQTGDEFQELGESFNRMLHHLVDAQDELRRVNKNLDIKVDELAQVNMRLYEMNRLKSDFLATVSHELRTPLNSIIGFSDVLNAIEVLDEKQKRYVENIQRSGRMLLEMINDILDLAKIESGRIRIRLTEFKIDSVITAQCDMARPLTEKKNIDLDCQIENHLPTLAQDQGKMQQILNNLLSNAIKFTPEGGRITVCANRDRQSRLCLVVADTGVGIADEDQVAIFEKFRQGTTVLSGGDAMTREYSGTGLGLSIVKELCRLLGGEISLESELGKGSTFTVVLPWTKSEQPPRESGLDEDRPEFGQMGNVQAPSQTDPPISPFFTTQGG